MFWVILGHSFLYMRYDANHPIGLQNLEHVFGNEMRKWTFQLVIGAELAVDVCLLTNSRNKTARRERVGERERAA